jgi:SAM-dependent methyltransferase
MFGGNSYADAEASLRAEAREILTMLPHPPGKLLDVGCAGGVFLDEARSAGFDVLGIEPNASMAQSARTRYSLNVLSARVEDLPFSWGDEVNVITLLDCLEHIPQPLVAIQKLRARLVPGGHLFIRGPLANTPLSRIKESLRRLVRIEKKLPGYPLDANVFNKRSMTTLCQNNGFAELAWKGEGPGFANLLATAVSAPHVLNDKVHAHGHAR